MKKWLSIMLALVLVCTASACGDTGAGEEGKNLAAEALEAEAGEDAGEQDQAQQQEGQKDKAAGGGAEKEDGEAKEQVSYPVTVTDQLGRQVTIEREPESIVSGYYISTSLLIALNLQGRLTGIEAKADSRPIYHLSAPDIIELPSVGSAKEFDLEGCAALNPDLVIVPARLKDSIPALEELGLTVIAVNPEDQELLKEAALLIGTAANALPQAERLTEYTEEKLALLEKVLSDAEKPSVYLASNSALLSAAGSGMYQSTLIENAGGVNAAGELEEDYWAEVSYEQLLSWDPEFIILAADAGYTVDSVLEDTGLAECRAVKEGHVYQFPSAIDAWDSPVPGSMLGSMWLAQVLHPEEYSGEEWKAAVKEFYETFYGFTPTDEEIDS